MDVCAIPARRMGWSIERRVVRGVVIGPGLWPEPVGERVVVVIVASYTIGECGVRSWSFAKE